MGTLESIKSLQQRLQSDNESDRWAAAAELGEYVIDHPDDIWPIVLRLASSEIEDVRQAVATNVLEHLLEHHFEKFFPLIESEIKGGNQHLRDSLKLCWKFGQSLDASRSDRWDSLLRKTRTK